MTEVFPKEPLAPKLPCLASQSDAASNVDASGQRADSGAGLERLLSSASGPEAGRPIALNVLNSGVPVAFRSSIAFDWNICSADGKRRKPPAHKTQ